jgi:hypothetical protein
VFNSPSKCENLEDDEEIRNVYCRETEELVKRVTGASKVMFFDFTPRWTEKNGGSPYNLGAANVAAAPVDYVHADYTPISAPARLR